MLLKEDHLIRSNFYVKSTTYRKGIYPSTQQQIDSPGEFSKRRGIRTTQTAQLHFIRSQAQQSVDPRSFSSRVSCDYPAKCLTASSKIQYQVKDKCTQHLYKHETALMQLTTQATSYSYEDARFSREA